MRVKRLDEVDYELIAQIPFDAAEEAIKIAKDTMASIEVDGCGIAEHSSTAEKMYAVVTKGGKQVGSIYLRPTKSLEELSKGSADRCYFYAGWSEGTIDKALSASKVGTNSFRLLKSAVTGMTGFGAYEAYLQALATALRDAIPTASVNVGLKPEHP